MNYDIKACGKRISQLRAKNGLTQEQVAGVLNIDRSFFSRIEAGKSGCSIDLCGYPFSSAEKSPGLWDIAHDRIEP